ncbi:hypothetical protein [Rhodococcus sp. NPDC047139]
MTALWAQGPRPAGIAELTELSSSAVTEALRAAEDEPRKGRLW